MQESDQPQFFASIARRLHEEGVLQTYEKPLGRQTGWHHFCKRSHKLGDKDTPGLVYHDGDEPYNELTTRQVSYFKSIDPKHEDLKLKTASVMKAITHYMPEKEFAAYLQFFTENLNLPSHRAALGKAFGNIREQLFHEEYEPEMICVADLEKLIVMGNSNAIRENLKYSTLNYEAVKNPELMLSLAIYQAAHMTYLDQLHAAINADQDISPDEKDNAMAVITEPFKQFHTSLLFATMAPLTLLARYNMGVVPGKTEDELMKQAISTAWGQFFDNKVLTRTYPATCWLSFTRIANIRTAHKNHCYTPVAWIAGLILYQ